MKNLENAAEKTGHVEREVCTDCGRMSDAVCPFDSTRCGECSQLRDDTRADCPAHGWWLPPMD